MEIKHPIKTGRDSNAELLRLVCMLFIVLHHFIVHALCPEIDGTSQLSTSISVYTLLNGFFYVGVNCFVLISGYYSIRLRFAAVWKLYLTCAFYGCLGYLIYVASGGMSLGKSILWNSVFIFSHSYWWFINCYLILMFFSPFLNAAIEKFTRYQHIVVIAIFAVLQIYFGYFWNAFQYDADGYHFLNMMFMYLIGSYLHKYVVLSVVQTKRWSHFLVYVAFSLMWGVITLLGNVFDISAWWHPLHYNNPMVIVASIGFFLFMMSFSFQSKVVNWLSGGVLAAYLLPDMRDSSRVIYPIVKKLLENYELPLQIILLFAVSLLTLLVLSVFDKLRAYLMQPLQGVGKQCWSKLKKYIQ